MNNLKVEQDKVKVQLKKEIYLKRAVLLACEAFSESCWVGLSANEESYKIELRPKQAGIELENLGYEFCNFVLGIMQNV